MGRSPGGTFIIVFVFNLVLAGGAFESTGAGPFDCGKLTYAIELDGVLCGYTESEFSLISQNGENTVRLDQYGYAKLGALGSELITEITTLYLIDPVSGRFRHHESRVSRGNTVQNTVIDIEDGKARCTSTARGTGETIDLAPGVITENSVYFPYLLEDFTSGGAETKTYEILDVKDFEIQRSTYRKAGLVDLDLGGRHFKAIVIDEFNHTTGLKVRIWLDTDNGCFLKARYPNKMVIYLADAGIKTRIRVANLNRTLIAETNVFIEDYRKICYMKVAVTLEPVGIRISRDGLNTGGQTFSGAVHRNLVDGVFEVRYDKYSGRGAPPFPPDFRGDKKLEQYLKPSAMIESNDSSLTEKASEITRGSRDSWEAAVRIGEWVGHNIRYDISRSGTARYTYDARAGECGAYSNLVAAFCRSVGIPARVVWGAMYIPQSGGSFGQHGWNEVYMGQAGWIPIDTTVLETDFCDSGHIRLGVMRSSFVSLNARRMEVIDYRTNLDGGN